MKESLHSNISKSDSATREWSGYVMIKAQYTHLVQWVLTTHSTWLFAAGTRRLSEGGDQVKPGGGTEKTVCPDNLLH